MTLRLPPTTLALALLALGGLTGATCQPAPDSKKKEEALLHYDMGVQAMQNNDIRMALIEQQKAVATDPDLDLAHNALAFLYHLSYGERERAIEHYQRALAINPKFSEAMVNLGNVYLDQARYDDALPLYEKALSDILYKTPYIAENNLGWCYYKKGEVQLAIDHIKSALVPNPKFCLGHRNLGIIYGETKQAEKAQQAFCLYSKHCPDVPDARYRCGRALLTSGDTEGAKRELGVCVEKGKDQPVGDDCRRLIEQLAQ
ncbi:MAG TPA: social motility TPR repeat lipoprotein Tgl [Myxococcales bacterium]|jgi:Tfp pilus assembly protein PilF